MEYVQDMADGGRSRNLSCPICLDEYQEPKVLTVCGHSFCCPCLTKVGSDGRYLKCPTCRTKSKLPQSGRVEDFPTNIVVKNLISDHPVLDQNRQKREVLPLPSKRRRHGTESRNCNCHQHKIPMKFYCETCNIRVCDECLLGDHIIGQHDIVPAAVRAVNLSNELQRVGKELQYYQQDKKNIHDNIYPHIGGNYCQKEEQRLKNVVGSYRQTKTQQLQNATDEMQNEIHEILQQIEQLQRTADKMKNKYHAKQQEKEQLHRDADMMCNKIEEKAAACERSLKQKYSDLTTLQKQIQRKGAYLDQCFQQHDLTHAGEVEQVYEDFDQFKSCIHSLNTDLQSNSIGLTIYEAKHEILGIKLHEL